MIPGSEVQLHAALLLQGCVLAALLQTVLPAGNVGCLFSEHVCSEEELCFDDLVIGRCISAASRDEDLIRSGSLSGPPLELLAAEMKRVFSQGYTWEDTYSQCVFHTLLDHIENNELYSIDECSYLMGDAELSPPYPGAEQFGGDKEDGYGGEVADTPAEEKIEFSGEVGDQFNFGPEYLEVEGQATQYSPEDPSAYMEDPSSYMEDPSYGREDLSSFPEDPSPYPEILPANVYTEDTDDDLYSPPQDDIYTSQQDDLYNPQQDDLYNPPQDDIYTPQQMPEIIPVYVPEDGLAKFVPETLDEDDDNTRSSLEDLQTLSDDLYSRPRAKRPSNDWIVLKEPDDADDNVSALDFDYYDSSAAEDGDDAVYYSQEARTIPMETIFDRRERLDVKKPGPFYANSQNSFFLDKLLKLEGGEEGTEDYQNNDVGQSEYELPLTMQNKQKKAFNSFLNADDPLLEYDDLPTKDSYLVVNIKDRFKTLGQALSVVDAVAQQLQVPTQAFGEPKLSTSRLSIPVKSNPRQLNASAMAGLLGDQVEMVNKRIDPDVGVQVDSFSSGTENEVVSIYTAGHSRLFLALFLLTAALASAILVGSLILVLRRRRGKKIEAKEEKEDKEEPVKEYKQLVRDWSRSSRASQSSGGAGAGGPEDGPKTRTGSEDGAARRQPLPGIAGKQQNSEGSRTSSTSSWQEEPGVNTMDISTGHMVLAYMEDHLNNKQRLEQEWVGLCAYEAEPSATSVAFKVENKKKNRYPDKLPYDHNRVLLNALINGTNSDYINASTVTDHDPRNPAYIVTQGPMAHTIADFWQMVWEQGSVVIVMLSRLAENGYQLAHRYWPEEGSQQYHIYEVHLVSEHVWCEDYLVRSLYLKNTQTGETRTVTQFHFLSWSDGATPESTKSLLEFRRKVNKSYRGRSCPIIVHCSDGVGRSGTYILIDMVLNRMNKGSKEIDIAATLEHIRDQRSGMVQTRSQFEFCLTAVAEETHAILKSLAQ